MTVPVKSSSFISPMVFQASAPASSSSATPPPNRAERDVPYIPGASPLLMELIRLGIVDEKGKVTEAFSETHQLPPLSQDQLKRFHQLRNWKEYDAVTVQECLLYFIEKYGAACGPPSVVGGGVPWILGWEYYCQALVLFGLENAKGYFSEQMKSEWAQTPPDLDIRMWVAWVVANDFPEIRKGFDAKLQQSAGEGKTLDLKRRRLINTLTDHSMNIPLEFLELTLYYKLNTEYLSGDRSLHLPCEFFLEEEIPEGLKIRPFGAQGINPLQAFVDRLLKQLNPHVNLNDRGWIRQMQYLQQGYGLDEQLRNRLSQVKFQNIRKLNLGDLLAFILKDCEKLHPSSHPAGVFFSALNAVCILDLTLPPQERQRLWGEFSEEIKEIEVMRPEIGILYHALIAEKRGTYGISKALLEMISFSLEVLEQEKEGRKYSSKLVYAGVGRPLGFQLACHVENCAPMHLQLQMSPIETYQKLLLCFSKLEDEAVLIEWINCLLMSSPLGLNKTSETAAHWKSLGIDLRSLRRIIFTNLHHPKRSMRILNFYLLCAVHVMEPLKASEMALLELFPFLFDENDKEKILLKLLERVLGTGYSGVFSYYVEIREHSPTQNLMNSWIAAFVQKNSLFSMTKLSQLLPRFQKHISQEAYNDLLKKILSSMVQKFPDQAFDLIHTVLEKNIKIDSFDFMLYCQTVFPLLNYDYQPIINANIEKLGRILLMFCHSELGVIKPNPIRSTVLLHIVDGLLESPYHEIGRDVLRICGPGHSMHPLFGNQFQFLNQKAFPISIVKDESALSAEFVQKRVTIMKCLDRSDMDGAIKIFVALLRLNLSPSHIPALHELLNIIWGKIAVVLASNFSVVPLKQAISVVHNQTIQNHFPYFCLEQHIFLTAKITELTEPLYHASNQDFLFQSLSNFYAHVPAQLKRAYCSHLIRILPFAWSLMNPLAPATRKLIEQVAPEMVKITNGDMSAQLTLIIELEKLRISIPTDRSEIVQRIYMMEKALRELPLSTSDQVMILKFLPELYAKEPISLPYEVLITFCEYAFRNSQVESGLIWLKKVFQIIDDESVEHRQQLISLLPTWFYRIQESKNIECLMDLLILYHELDGPTLPLEPIFTDRFLATNPKMNLDYFLEYPFQKLFENNRAEGRQIAEKLLTIMMKQKTLTEGVMRKCLNLLLAAHTNNSNLWVSIYRKIAVSRSPALKSYAFQFLHTALNTGYLWSDDFNRIECWMLATRDMSVFTPQLIDEWIADGSELKRVFSIGDTQIVSPELQLVYRYIYGVVRGDLTEESAERLVLSHEKLCDYFIGTPDLNKCWLLDLELVNSIRNKITPAAYEILTRLIWKRLFSLSIPIKFGDKAVEILYEVSKLTFKTPLENDPAILFIRDIATGFKGETWVVDYLCNCADRRVGDRLYVLRRLLLEAFESIDLEEDGRRCASEVETFKSFFTQSLWCLINHTGGLYTRLVLELLMDHRVKSVVGEDKFSTLVEWLIEKSFSMQIRDRNSKIIRSAGIQGGIIQKAMDIFFPVCLQLPIKAQKRLWLESLAITTKYLEEFGEINHSKDFYIRICRLDYKQQNTQELFHKKLWKVTRAIYAQKCHDNPDLTIQVTHCMINHLFLESEKNNFVDLESVFFLIEEYCFNLDRMTPNMSITHHKLADDLMDKVNETAVKYSEILSLQHPLKNYLRGWNCMEDYLFRLARSQSTSTLCYLLEICAGDKRVEQLELKSLEKLLKVFFVSLKTNPLRKYGETYLIGLANNLLIPVLESLIRSGIFEHAIIANNIAKAMIEMTEVLTIEGYLNKESPYNNMAYTVDLLRSLVFAGVYRDNPNEYWNICEKQSDIMMKISTTSNDMFHVLCGLMLTDEKVVECAPIRTKKAEDQKNKLFQQLVDDQIEKIKTPGQAKNILKGVDLSKWNDVLPISKEKDRIVEKLKRLAAKKKRR